MRVELDEMDRLLEGVTEATVQLHALQRETDALERAHRLASMLADQLQRGGETTAAQLQSLAQVRDDLATLRRGVGASIEQVGAELGQVRDAANRLRLLPASIIFGALRARRARRGAGRRKARHLHDDRRRPATGRARAHGAPSALLHLVRNAVAHGIEPAAERQQLGKSPAGAVALRVEQRGSQVAFTCEDDGRGIDASALRRAAEQRGDAAPNTDLFELLVRRGTTSVAVDEVSGRGIGLDVVRSVAERLKGRVTVRSELRVGTSFEIRVPVSMASRLSLGLRAEDVTSSVPLEAIRATLRVADADIAREAEGVAWQPTLESGTVIPDEKGVNYRNHGPGRLLLGGPAALQRLRGSRHHQARQHL